MVIVMIFALVIASISAVLYGTYIAYHDRPPMTKEEWKGGWNG